MTRGSVILGVIIGQAGKSSSRASLLDCQSTPMSLSHRTHSQRWCQEDGHTPTQCGNKVQLSPSATSTWPCAIPPLGPHTFFIPRWLDHNVQDICQPILSSCRQHEISHGGSPYTTEMGKHFKSRYRCWNWHSRSPSSWWLHTNGAAGPDSLPGTLDIHGFPGTRPW